VSFIGYGLYTLINRSRALIVFTGSSHSSSSSLYATPPSIIQFEEEVASTAGICRDSSISTQQSPNDPDLSDEEYNSCVQAAGLLLDASEELNWSGKGMHVTFTPTESLPLRKIGTIVTNRSKIEAVICRRIKLCRKSRICHRRFTIKDALEEVRHMQHLKHSHIVRLVGSYFLIRHLSILSYPVADQDLRQMMLNAADRMRSAVDCASTFRTVFRDFFPCLSSAMRYIHSCNLKHMDLKPQNILVSGVRSGCLTISNPANVRVYITDFGTSRYINTEGDDSRTDGPTERTEMYCSPEVADKQPRGRASDIFSLGCVFIEIETCIAGESLEKFRIYRTDEGSSFHRNLGLVAKWIGALPIDDEESTFVIEARRNTFMAALEKSPEKRPTAADLCEQFPPRACCSKGPVPFEVMEV
jgi:hypothetical protein